MGGLILCNMSNFQVKKLSWFFLGIFTICAVGDGMNIYMSDEELPANIGGQPGSGKVPVVSACRVTVSHARIDPEYVWLWDEIKPLLRSRCNISHLNLIAVGVGPGLIVNNCNFVPTCHLELQDSALPAAHIYLGVSGPRKVLCLQGADRSNRRCATFPNWDGVLELLNIWWRVGFDPTRLGEV